jgi:hypothetical protein
MLSFATTCAPLDFSMEVGEPPMTPQLFSGKLGEPPPQQLTAAAAAAAAVESSSLQRERERKKERNKSLLAGRKL